MTPAEFKSTRESLHLTVTWLAMPMQVRKQSVQRWENGHFVIPDTVAATLHELEVFTQNSINEGIKAHKDPIIVPFQDERPETDMPPAWYRMVAKQIANQTGARLEYQHDDR